MVKKIILPEAVSACCGALRRAGHAAHPVGGGVRDLLLGRIPVDWDVTTSAPPEDILALLPHAVLTGGGHGTVTVLMDGIPIEVTPFRGESGYSDGRHPDRVTFGVSLDDDLARRDFTVNALALDENNEVIDRFGGLDDLEQGMLRCVGEPERRFGEDRLRMFRALRFAAQLGFTLHPTVAEALEQAPSTAGLAAERVRVEVEKALLSPDPRWVGEMARLGLLAPWLVGSVHGGTASLAALPAEPLARWAGLAALWDEEELPVRLKLPNRLRRPIEEGLALLRSGLPADPRGWRHALARYGGESCRAAAYMAGGITLLDEVLAADPCVTVTRLALSGGDLAALGLSGPDIGAAQQKLLAHVLDHPEDNTREKLNSLL